MIILLGGQKSGTTTLSDLLNKYLNVEFLKHQNIFEIKNDELFEKKFQEIFSSYTIKDLDNSNSFGILRQNILVNTTAINRLIKYFPNSNYIVSLREPLSRTVSAYFHYMKDRLINIETLDYGLNQLLDNFNLNKRAFEILSFSNYSNGLEILLNKAINIHIFDFLRIGDFIYVEKFFHNIFGHSVCLPNHFKTHQKTPNNLFDVLETYNKNFPFPNRICIDKKTITELSKVLYSLHPDYSEKKISSTTFDRLYEHIYRKLDWSIVKTHNKTSNIFRSWLKLKDELKVKYISKNILSKKTFKTNPLKSSNSLSKKLHFLLCWVEGSSPFDLKVKSLYSRDDHPSKVNFIADPFFIQHSKKKYIFAETRYPQRGVIDVFEYLNTNKIIFKGNAISENFHLSYPNIFEYDKEFFLIPESIENNSIRIYKASLFPLSWQLFFEIEGIFTDPTIFIKEKIFVFYSRKGVLHLGMLDLIKRNIIEHPCSPITDSFIGNRSGGAIFKYGEFHFRPSQRGKPEYGFFLDLFKINEINENSYSEELYMENFLPKFSKFNDEDFSQRVHHIDIKKFKSIFMGVIDGRDLDGYLSI